MSDEDDYDGGFNDGYEQAQSDLESEINDLREKVDLLQNIVSAVYDLVRKEA